jgi:hypothetical protein
VVRVLKAVEAFLAAQVPLGEDLHPQGPRH